MERFLEKKYEVSSFTKKKKATLLAFFHKYVKKKKAFLTMH